MYYACGKSGEITENKVLQVLTFHQVNYILCGSFQQKSGVNKLLFPKETHSHARLGCWLLLSYPQKHVALSSLFHYHPFLSSLHSNLVA